MQQPHFMVTDSCVDDCNAMRKPTNYQYLSACRSILSSPSYFSNSHLISSFVSFHQESYACPSNRALPMPGTADGDAVSRCQDLGRAGSVHLRADQ